MRGILIICILLLNICHTYGQKKILIVGDSWAETIWRSNVFDDVLQEYGFPSGLAEGGEGSKDEGTLIAIGGSRADQWAQNYLGWQGRIKSLIDENPSVTFIHLIIGGNDLLKIITKDNIMVLSSLEREQIIKNIKINIEKLVQFCLCLKSDLKVLICDYDYLNIDNAKKVYGYDFDGMNQAQLNQIFMELGLKKKEIADNNDRCFYLNNWGVLNNYFNNEVSSEYNDLSMPVQADFGDGIHPNIEAHQIILRRAVELFYKEQLFH